jgi:PmbA protein
MVGLAFPFHKNRPDSEKFPQMDWMNVTQEALDAARRHGAEEAEVYLSRSVRRRVLIRGRAAEGVERSEAQGLGLRVLRGGRMGFSFGSALSREGLEGIASRAVESSALGRSDADFAFSGPPKGARAPRLDEERAALTDGPSGEALRAALETAEGAYAADARVVHCEARYGDYDLHVALATSQGFRGAYSVSNCHAGCEAVVQDGEEKQSSYQSDFAPSPGSLAAGAIGKKAAEAAVRKLRPKSWPTGRCTVLMDSEQVMELLAVLENSFSADEVLKRKSALADKLGTAVASPAFSLYADPRRASGPFPVPFDDEGTLTGRVALVREGMLTNYLHDMRTAAKFSQLPTGSAFRQSHSSRPMIGFGQAVLEPGTLSFGDILRRLGTGLYVTELMGTHTVDSVSGEFSLGAVGAAVRGGELAEGVAGVALAGNLFDMLRNVAAAGADFRWFSRGIGTPSLLVEGLTASGTGSC